MSALQDVVERDLTGRAHARALSSLEGTVAPAEVLDGVASSSDGNVIMAATDRRIIIVREKTAPTTYALSDLHSVSVIGTGDSALFAPLQLGEAFDSITLDHRDATRIAEAVRTRLGSLRASGDQWPWDSPQANLGISVWPTGLLARPARSPVPAKQWCVVTFVNTGVQIRTYRHPKQSAIYHGDVREFLAWPQVRNVSVEGDNIIERRPSIGSVLAFGIAGLAASEAHRRAYFVIESDDGDYVFEQQEILPVALSGVLAPILREMRDPSVRGTNATVSARDLADMLAAQQSTNALLAEILEELRSARRAN